MVEAIAQTSLPPIDDPRWPIEARRAVVDRLLVTLAGEGDRSRIDQLADLLGSELAELLGRAGSAQDDTPELAEALMQARLAELRRIDLAGSAAVRAEEVLRLLAGRRSMTEGSAMRFAASQVAATELLAEIVRLERPAEGDRVDEVLEWLSAERADSESVFEQMAVTERRHSGCGGFAWG